MRMTTIGRFVRIYNISHCILIRFVTQNLWYRRHGYSTLSMVQLSRTWKTLIQSRVHVPLGYADGSRFSLRKPKWHVRPAKTQNSLGIRPIWSESSLCTHGLLRIQAFFKRTAKTDQTGLMPRLICVLAGRTATLLVLSCRGSYYITVIRRYSYL